MEEPRHRMVFPRRGCYPGSWRRQGIGGGIAGVAQPKNTRSAIMAAMRIIMPITMKGLSFFFLLCYNYKSWLR